MKDLFDKILIQMCYDYEKQTGKPPTVTEIVVFKKQITPEAISEYFQDYCDQVFEGLEER